MNGLVGGRLLVGGLGLLNPLNPALVDVTMAWDYWPWVGWTSRERRLGWVQTSDVRSLRETDPGPQTGIRSPSTWLNPRTPVCIQVQFLTHEWHLFHSLAVLDPTVGHTMDVLSPFIAVLWHSDWLFNGESCPRLDVVHPGRAWSSSPESYRDDNELRWYLQTAFADRYSAISRVCPSVCLFSFYLLNLLTFSGGHVPECVGHDHRLLWVAKQSQGLRLGLGLAEMITRSVWPWSRSRTVYIPVYLPSGTETVQITLLRRINVLSLMRMCWLPSARACGQ